eukprot:12631398-Alexandrium_andersonii.AAC.1
MGPRAAVAAAWCRLHAGRERRGRCAGRVGHWHGGQAGFRLEAVQTGLPDDGWGAGLAAWFLEKAGAPRLV